MEVNKDFTESTIVKETQKIIMYLNKDYSNKEVIYTVCSKNGNILYADFDYLKLISYLKKEKIISKKEYEELESIY